MEGHAIVTQETGIEIVGDDLFTTNIERVKMGVEMGAANSMVLKITQVGTVSEALDAARILPAPRLQCPSLRQPWVIATASPTLRWAWARAGARFRLASDAHVGGRIGRIGVWPGKALFKGQKSS